MFWVPARHTILHADTDRRIIRARCSDVTAAIDWAPRLVRQAMTSQLLAVGMVAGAVRKKRPCCICRRWFLSDAKGGCSAARVRRPRRCRMIKVTRVGAWLRAFDLLDTGAQRVRVALDKAMLQEGQFLRTKVVEGLREQAPGGRAFTPLAPTNVA